MRDFYGEAFEDGRMMEKETIAKNLLDHQVPIATIVSSTGLSREEVLELRAGI